MNKTGCFQAFPFADVCVISLFLLDSCEPLGIVACGDQIWTLMLETSSVSDELVHLLEHCNKLAVGVSG